MLCCGYNHRSKRTDCQRELATRSDRRRLVRAGYARARVVGW